MQALAADRASGPGIIQPAASPPQGKWLIVAVALLAAIIAIQLPSATADEGSREQRLAEQFYKALRQRPRYGTAFDRVLNYHRDAGTQNQLLKQLKDEANDSAQDAEQRGVASMLAGMIDLQEGNPGEAVTMLSQAAGLRPRDATVHWYLAKACVRSSDMTSAVASFRTAIDAMPPKPDLLEIYQDFGKALQQSGQLEEALSIWKQMADEFPRDTMVRQRIADALSEARQFPEAITQYQELARLTSDRYQALQFQLKAAELTSRAGDPQAAREDMEKLLDQLKPDSWLSIDIRRRIEATFARDADPSSLAQYYEAWLSRHPDDVRTLARMSRLKSADGDPDKAREFLRRAIELSPTELSLYRQLIDVLVQSGHVAEAIQLCEQAESQGVRPDREFLTRWGQLYLQADDENQPARIRQAVAVWRRIPGDGSDAGSVADVALLFRGAGLTDEAISLYRTAIQDHPDQFPLYSSLAKLLSATDRREEAVSVIRQFPLNHPSAESLSTAARFLYELKEAQPAIELMRSACSGESPLSDRILFSQMLRDQWLTLQSAGTERTPDADALIDEAVRNLSVAEQQATTPFENSRIIEELIQTWKVAGRLAVETEMLSRSLTDSEDDFTGEQRIHSWLKLAAMLEAGGQVPAAIETVRSAAKLAPERLDITRRLAELLQKADRLREAIEVWALAAEADPQRRFQYFRSISELELSLGNREAALAAARTAFEHAATDPEIVTFLAQMQLDLGEADAAIGTLRDFAGRSQDNAAAHAALAAALADQFRTPEAVQSYWEAFDYADSVDEQESVVVNLMLLAQRSRQTTEIMRQLRMRTARIPDPLDAAVLNSTALLAIGDPDASFRELESLLVTQPGNTRLLRRCVRLAEIRGDHEAAVEFQTRLSEHSAEGDERSRLTALEVLAESDSVGDALLRSFRAGLLSREELVDRIDSLIASGQEAEAASVCQQLLNRPGDSSESWQIPYRLAIALWRLGDRPAALEQFAGIASMPKHTASVVEETPSDTLAADSSAVSLSNTVNTESADNGLPQGYASWHATDSVCRILMLHGSAQLSFHSFSGRPDPKFWRVGNLRDCQMISDEIIFRSQPSPARRSQLGQAIGRLSQESQPGSNALWTTFFRAMREFGPDVSLWIRQPEQGLHQETGLAAILCAVASDSAVADLSSPAPQLSTAASRLTTEQLDDLVDALRLLIERNPQWLLSTQVPNLLPGQTESVIERVCHLLRWHGRTDILPASFSGNDSAEVSPAALRVALQIAIHMEDQDAAAKLLLRKSRDGSSSVAALRSIFSVNEIARLPVRQRQVVAQLAPELVEQLCDQIATDIRQFRSMGRSPALLDLRNQYDTELQDIE
ncbi:MAG: tetratricopeptide repeat protein, partial [Planctomycetaceae bacterium]|nr:tetratricopeptide repeat protein [Planctomycetaceae bacterium]